MNGLRSKSKLYTGVMMVLGLAAVAHAAWGAFSGGASWYWLLLAAITVVTGPFAIKVPGVNARVSIADTVTFTNMVLFGVPAGTLTAMLDGVTGSLRCKTVSRRLEFALFNAAAMAVSAYAGGGMYTMVTGGAVLQPGAAAPSNLLPGLGVLALVFYLCNSSFVALMVSLEQGGNFLAVWRARFLWPASNYVAAAAVAGLLAQTEGAITGLLVLTILSTIAAIWISSRGQAESVAAEGMAEEAAPQAW